MTHAYRNYRFTDMTFVGFTGIQKQTGLQGLQVYRTLRTHVVYRVYRYTGWMRSVGNQSVPHPCMTNAVHELAPPCDSGGGIHPRATPRGRFASPEAPLQASVTPHITTSHHSPCLHASCMLVALCELGGARLDPPRDSGGWIHPRATLRGRFASPEAPLQASVTPHIHIV